MVNIFPGAESAQKNMVFNIVRRIDHGNIAKYQRIIKNSCAALNRINLRFLIFISALGLLTSCATKKQNSNVQKYNSDSLSETNIDFSASLGRFVETIDLNKLCHPVRLYVMFSVDTSGKIYDSDFKPTIFSDKNCMPDTVYMNEMKIKFENKMPLWKTEVINDSIKALRYSIPVTFD